MVEWATEVLGLFTIVPVTSKPDAVRLVMPVAHAGVVGTAAAGAALAAVALASPPTDVGVATEAGKLVAVVQSLSPKERDPVLPCASMDPSTHTCRC